MVVHEPLVKERDDRESGSEREGAGLDEEHELSPHLPRPASSHPRTRGGLRPDPRRLRRTAAPAAVLFSMRSGGAVVSQARRATLVSSVRECLAGRSLTRAPDELRSSRTGDGGYRFVRRSERFQGVGRRARCSSRVQARPALPVSCASLRGSGTAPSGWGLPPRTEARASAAAYDGHEGLPFRATGDCRCGA
jgi:hypothetical protein